MTLFSPLLVEAVTGDTAITYHAQDYRNIIGAFVPNQGTLLAADLAVTQRGAGANMSVDVAAGTCVVKGGSVAHQGTYICYSDATTNVAIAAANASNPRIDLIVAQVHDKQADGGSTYGWTLTAVAGTPAASPSAPAVPVSALVLAQVYVPANAVSILNTGTNLSGGTGSITDKRVLCGTGDVPKWEVSGTSGTPQSVPDNSTTRYIPNATTQLVGVTTTGMSTGEVQIVTPGRYVVHFCFRLPAGTAAYNITASVRHTDSGGSTILRQIALDILVNGGACAAAGTMYCAAGDRIAAWIYQASGAAKSINDANKETAFTGVWVGA